MTADTQDATGMANRNADNEIHEDVGFALEENGPMTSKELKEELHGYGYDKHDARMALRYLRQEGEVVQTFGVKGAVYYLPHQKEMVVLDG